MSTSKIVLNILRICISVLIIILVVFGVMKLGTVAYDLGYRIFMEKPMEDAPGTDVTIEITEGMSPASIGKALEEEGLIRDVNLFVIQMKVSPYADKVKPGIYTLSTAQTVREMLAVMSTEESEESEDGETEQ